MKVKFLSGEELLLEKDLPCVPTKGDEVCFEKNKYGTIHTVSWDFSMSETKVNASITKTLWEE